MPSPAPSEPCFFYFRAHQLHKSGKALITIWAKTDFTLGSVNQHSYPLDLPKASTGVPSPWRQNYDQAYLYYLTQVSRTSGINPHPDMLFEVVRIPKKIIPAGLPEFRIPMLIDNISSTALRSQRREQHGNLVDIFIDKLPDNSVDAKTFYTAGDAFLNTMHNWVTAANAPPVAVVEDPAPAPVAAPASAAAPSAPRPTIIHQTIAARSRPPRGNDPHAIFQKMKQLRRIKAGGSQPDAADESAAPAPAPERPVGP